MVELAGQGGERRAGLSSSVGPLWGPLYKEGNDVSEGTEARVVRGAVREVGSFLQNCCSLQLTAVCGGGVGLV